MVSLLDMVPKFQQRTGVTNILFGSEAGEQSICPTVPQTSQERDGKSGGGCVVGMFLSVHT